MVLENKDLLEERLIQKTSLSGVGVLVGGLDVGGERKGALQVEVNDGLVLIGYVETCRDVVELAGDSRLLASEEVKGNCVRVVSLEHSFTLAQQPPLPLLERNSFN